MATILRTSKINDLQTVACALRVLILVFVSRVRFSANPHISKMAVECTLQRISAAYTL